MVYTNNNCVSNSPTKSPETLHIWQENVNKSRTCQHDLISSTALARRGIDIVALQEPAISSFGTTIASREGIPIYPSMHSKEPSKIHSVLLLRSNLLTENWKQVDFPSGDVTVVQLNGKQGKLTLFNVYNDCEKNNTVQALETFTHSLIAHIDCNSKLFNAIIWLGDFNRHHLHWDNLADTRLFTRSAIDNAELLISAVAGLGLDLALPPGIPTHLHSISKKWTRLDQVFISEDYMEAIITCDALVNTPGINTSHLPIFTTLDLSIARAPSAPPRNFHNVDWESFEEALTARLSRVGPQARICSSGELDNMCLKLTQALQETIEEKVPKTNLRVKAKKWWTKELTKLRQNANRTGHKASKYQNWPDHHSHAERREANKIFQRTLERTKRQHWRDWLEKADDPDIWTAHQYTSSPAGDSGKSRIPILKLTRESQETTATTNKEKSRLLAQKFFPLKPPDDLPLQFVYPKPACDFDPISRDLIKAQLTKLKPYKAPGPDGIPNIVLTRCANAIYDRLYYIYKAIIELGIYYMPPGKH